MKPIYWLKRSKIKEVEALLADAGILVGADWFTQLAAISARGGDEQIIQSLTNLVERVSAALPNVARQLFGSVADNIMDAAMDAGTGLYRFIKKYWK